MSCDVVWGTVGERHSCAVEVGCGWKWQGMLSQQGSPQGIYIGVTIHLDSLRESMAVGMCSVALIVKAHVQRGFR